MLTTLSGIAASHNVCASSFKGKSELQPLLDTHSLCPGPFPLPVLGALWRGRGSSQLCHPWFFLPVLLRQRERSVNPSVRHRYIPLLNPLIHRDCICVFFSWYYDLERSYLPSWEWICTHPGHLSDSLPHFVLLMFLFKWIYFLALYYRWSSCP